MKYEILLIVPADLDVTAKGEDGSYLIGADFISTLYELSAEYTEWKTPSTEIVGGKKLIHARIVTDSADVENLVKGDIIIFELGWTLVGIRETDPLEAIITWDDDLQKDVVIGYKSKIVMPIDEAVMDYLPELVDEAGTPLAKTTENLGMYLSSLHLYSIKGSKWAV
jgi:hypothetical protein